MSKADFLSLRMNKLQRIKIVQMIDSEQALRLSFLLSDRFLASGY
jgi:hypothetical protein